MKKGTAQRGRPALDLIEDAVHLLRTTPARVLLVNFVGAIPFALGLLYFWADMSRGAFAHRRCPAAALGMAVLFLWLKCWQTLFVSKLREQLAAGAESRWTLRRALRVMFVQGIVQPSRLFLLPVTLILTIPFGTTVAFYESLTVLGDGMEFGVRTAIRRAATQARVWPAQNHMLLAVLGLVAVVVWLNAVVAVFALPHLLKTLLGIQTVFTRAGIWAIFNTTFLAATVALAWLVLDPLVKAVYMLRCFHGEARKDGEDLLAELSFVRAKGKPIALAALVIFALLPFSARTAEERAPFSVKAEPPPTIPAVQIDDAVKQTLQHDKYAWRLPREVIVEEESAAQGWLRTFFESIGNTLAGWARSLRDLIRDILEWFNKHFKPKPKPVDDSGPHHIGWMGLLRGFAYLLLALSVAALALLVVRLWRQGWRRSEIVRAKIDPASPDLNDQNITAAQLPEDEWLRLANEMLAKGELRLALRAFYLATLAHLATREILTIARFKSNRDYETEVNRRARGLLELRTAFSANVSSFDRAWYGLHEVTAAAIAQFQSNFDRIRSC